MLRLTCRRILIAFALASTAVGCKAQRDVDRAGQPNQPLVVLLSPSHASGAPADAREALQSFLAKETGLAIKVSVGTSPGQCVEAFGSQAADVGLLTLFEYLLAHREYGAQARLQVLRAEGNASYAGEILVRADSDIRAVKDLGGKRFAFVDEYSVSGFLLPAQLLASQGVRPLTQFAGSHDQALAMLRTGRTDAASVYRGAASDDPLLRALAPTGTVPNEPVLVNSKLAAEKANAVLGALVKLAAIPDGAKVLNAFGGVLSLRPVTDAAYADVTRTIATLGMGVEDLVPGGRAIAVANRAAIFRD